VDHYVRTARAEGRSWTDIGDALGVSKQGAQQRFAPPVAAGAEPWPSGFSAAGQAAVAEAVEAARRLGHRYVGTEHLLLGLLSDEGGLAKRCLERLSLSRALVEAEVIDQIGRGENPPQGSLGMTPRTKRALEAARKEARRDGHRCPEPEHLLLALYTVPNGVAAQILAAADAPEQQTRAALADLLEAQAPELAERIRHPRRRRLSRR
jgi:ATP-dependent Clp protease ATP-binding subunit ClpA